MKFILILVLILVAYPAVSYGRLKFVTSQANLPKIVQPEKVIGSGPSFKYIAAGDSTALGIGASVVEKTYTHRIAEYLGNKFAVEYKNIGVPGAQTHDIINNQLKTIIDYRPDLVTISIGANDITHLKDTGEVLNNYRYIIEQLTKETDAKIYITNVARVDEAKLLPYLYRWYLARELKWLNPRLLELETERVTIIDIHEYGWYIYSDESITFSADRFHPSDEGYNNWTKAFLSDIEKEY